MSNPFEERQTVLLERIIKNVVSITFYARRQPLIYC